MNNPPQEHESLAARFYADQVLRRLVGETVVFTQEVERASFTVPAGARGTVQEPFMNDGLLVAAIELEEPLEGAEDYDNEVHWIEDSNLFDFEDQVELA